ncbi:MAG TPA: branched-chain amino acid ABC transporter permease [Symbiobacteriaceae bacterium]|jgi:branched-chain amino acid transport system permease protein|nr:branched-chain amino acid ABC transporter permease [Symbiobacteriaceae bacterium]
MRGMLQDQRKALLLVLPVVGVMSLLQVLFPFNTLLFIGVLLSMLLVQQSVIPKWIKVALAVVVTVGVIPLAGKENGALTFLCVQMFINIALALGLNLVVGFAGLLDLGYIAFFAGGAYVYAIFGSKQAAEFLPESLAHFFPLGGWWFWVCIPIAIFVAAFLGLALGLPVLRLRGDYLAIVTLGFGEIIAVLAKNLDHPINLSNGARGIVGITAPSLFGYKLDTTLGFYFIGLVFAVVAGIAMYRLERSRTGRAWAAMREDEVAARAMGINLTKYKLLAFMAGAAFAGAMGMLFAVKQNFVSPDSFSFVESIGILAMVILGGLGSIEGAVIGAISVTVIRLLLLKDLADFLSIKVKLPPAFNIPQYQPLIFGLILIVMMIYRQQGLLPGRRPQEDLKTLEQQPSPPSAGTSLGQGG